MIPPVVTDATLSPGEREIFERLRDDDSTRGWTVLHSYDLARHQRALAGEIDFVIIIPGKGVLCLEVKAARAVAREEGIWYYGRDRQADPRGPFKQAAEAMHSLRRRLVEARPDLNGVVFWSAVAFTYVEFRDESPEWHPWQVIDSRAMRTRGVGVLVERVLDNARTYLTQSPAGRWFDPAAGLPDEAQCAAIVETLRGDFEFTETPKAALLRREAEVLRFTQEQVHALDAMAANAQVVFEGPAGTGKTVLAVEAARRGAAAGRRVLFVCFNRLLGEALREQTAAFGANVVACTLHHHMRLAAGLEEVESPGSTFWDTELPAMAIDALLEGRGAAFSFDELVIDEAQDILRENYLDVLDLSLRGGLAAGRWRIFGDFIGQNVYDSANISLDQFLTERAGNASRYLLTRNCRNTPRIAELASHLPGLERVYSGVLRADDYLEPTLHFYRDSAEQARLLLDALERLYQEGFSGSDIVVLSARSDPHAIAKQVSAPPWRDRLRPLAEVRSGQVGYCSIHAFKGLEAPAVVVTDLDYPTNRAFHPLVYVAVTRARHRLTLLAGESARPALACMLQRPMATLSQ